MQLSWDLHVHPGPSSVPRWGGGAEIQAACARAGIAGFVWKSHEGHTAQACRALPTGGPRPIGSASLNAWATPDSVREALADGAAWVWGPTYLDGHVGWDLPLPATWNALADVIRETTRPLVLATGHLGARGRMTFAMFARTLPHVTCSITHSLYLGMDEVAALSELGCLFEVDLYTSTRAIQDRPQTDAAKGIAQLQEAGGAVYLTTDCGQKDIGDPYIFSHSILAGIAAEIGDEAVAEVAVAAPRRLVEHVVGGRQ
jgi:hypothetical protein